MLDTSAAFAAFPTLETPRLILRAVTLDDAEAVFQIMSDPRVTRYFGRAPMTALDEALERVRSFETDFAAQNGIRWGIASREDGRLLGTCGFWRLLKQHYRAEIGYELSADAWGRGLMTEAVGAILGFGFGPLGLHSAEAQIDPENAGSRRVLEKLGFAQEGYFRQNYYLADQERFSDTAVFSLLRERWVAG